MPVTIIRTIQTNGNGYRIPIPRYVLDALHWRPHDHLAFTINTDDTITLARVAVPPLHTTPRPEAACDTSASPSTK